MSVNGLEITGIKLTKSGKKDGSAIGWARIILNGCFVVDRIGIMQGKFGEFLTFPKERNESRGQAYNYAYPITKSAHDYISERVLRMWREGK